MLILSNILFWILLGFFYGFFNVVVVLWSLLYLRFGVYLKLIWVRVVDKLGVFYCILWDEINEF